MVSIETQDYVYGLYGKPPVPISDEIKKLVLKGYKRGKESITCRPADIIKPEMEKAKEETKGLAKNLCDTLIYALYPKTGVEFLKWKYGLEPMPERLKPKTLEDIKNEDEASAKAKAEVQKKSA
jgi:pyruvate carboxylase subunit B